MVKGERAKSRNPEGKVQGSEEEVQRRRNGRNRRNLGHDVTGIRGGEIWGNVAKDSEGIKNLGKN